MLLRARRLQRDTLFDTPGGSLRERGCALRVRLDGDRSILTYKGPVQPGSMKVRDEYETPVEHGDALVQILGALGYSLAFRYEKYREEFRAPGLTVAIDETPIGVYVELEGDEPAIRETVLAMGRAESDFILSSYRGLFKAHCKATGVNTAHMTFPA